MEKLEITYEISGFDRVLYDKPPSCPLCQASCTLNNQAL